MASLKIIDEANNEIRLVVSREDDPQYYEDDYSRDILQIFQNYIAHKSGQKDAT
ncbi:MAG TPA: hypothetical protein VH144_03520 [Candidatus Saccharimonadales bacterium]|jgi:hypothetical protein|nr:hypothetical protein [Candidatus Saccharimonadales bacterium]